MIKYLKILFLFCTISAFAQEPGMKNYTTLDGLPSDEVYQSFIDRDGYLWFATNSGVCYYDGDVFKTLDIADGLPDNTILEIEEDAKGRIWFSGISGNLSYYDKGKIIPFKYNYLIHQLKRQTELIASGEFQPIDTNEVIFITNRAKRIHIKKDSVEIENGWGLDTILISREKDRYKFFFFYDSKSHIYRYIAAFNDSTKPTFEEKLPNFTIDFVSYHLYQEFDDKVIYFIKKQALVFYKSGKVEKIPLDFAPIYSLKGIYGGLWIGTKSKGLMYFRDDKFSREPKIRILNNRRVTSLRYDQNTRGWVTTFSSGICNVQSLYITNYLYPNSNDINKVSNIIQLNNGITIGFSKGNSVFKFHKDYQTFDLIKIPELQNEIIYSVKVYKSLVFIATNYHMVVVDQDYFVDPDKHVKPEIYPINNVKDFVIQDSILWVVNSAGLFYYPDLLKYKSDKRFEIPNHLFQRSNVIIKYHSVSNDSGFSYLLYNDLKTIYKVRYKKNEPQTAQYASFQFPDTISVSSANDIKINNEHIFIGSKGMGLIIIHKDSVQFLNRSDGLISNYIKKVEIWDSRKLYLATNKGLNIIYFSDSLFSRIDSIKQITDKDGLLSNHINDFINFDDHVLCATNKGISLINIPEVISMKDEFPIHIKQFKVNDKNIYDKSIRDYQLKADENNLIVSFDAVDFHDKEGLKYYYQLEGSSRDRWNEISKPIVVFPKMTAGDYTLLVKARNSYGFESKNIAELKFSIAKKRYQTWLFRMGFILFVGTLFYLILRYFFNKRNQLLRTEKLLAEYQQQSLTRLINPHFLMNVFNSISSNLFNKKPGLAMAYIKEISELVKLIFDSAYYNKTTLEEEVKLLKSYINIEKRRSPSEFTEVIKFDPQIKDYFIPSLITQIFIENAIHHGFSDFKTKGALLSISFIDKDPYILCKIVDNGMGITASQKLDKLASHRPRKHGIEIIQERLELLNRNLTHVKYKLDVFELKKENEETARGTRVEIWFPKQEKKTSNKSTIRNTKQHEKAH